MADLAIVTTLYNRCEEVQRLCDSLMNQTCSHNRFAWYVVDDGSVDGGLDCLAARQDSLDFSIQLLRKRNGGKHTALNYAIPLITEKLTFIVDSDDVLPPESILQILEVFEGIENSEGLCGVSFLREMESSPAQVDCYPTDMLRGTYADVRLNMGIAGDKAEVFYTNCLKEFPFPEYSGELFYHEDGVWLRMSERYEMLHVNKVVYRGSYLESGLTYSGKSRKLASPLGMVDRSAVFLRYPGRLKFIVRVKHAVLWDVYSRIAGYRLPEMIARMPSRVLCLAAYPLAAAIRRRWIREQRKSE